MKSPNLHSAFPNSFTQSTISSMNLSSNNSYENKGSPSLPPKQHFDYSKSYVYENTKTKKEQATLRKTINYDETLSPPTTKSKLQNFLRNTSYFSIEDEKTPNIPTLPSKHEIHSSKEEKNAWNFSNSVCYETKTSNYEKILEKIQKKQKLINELKQLSKFTIIDHNKKINNEKNERKSNKNIEETNPKDYTETNRNSYNTQPYSEPNSPISPMLAYKKEQKSALNIFKQKVEIKLPESSKNTEITVKNKNPEEQMGKTVFKKAKESFYTPKEMKSNPSEKVQDRFYSKLALSRVQPVEVKEFKPQSNLYNSCKYVNQPKDCSSPLPRGQYLKTIQDIRHVSDAKRIKATTTYFASKGLSIYDFQLLKTLGQGKFGTVIQAIHKQTQSIYAIKKISKKVIKNNIMGDQLLKEIKIQSYCQHENILQLYGAFSDSEFIYLVLEYMEQGTLFGQLKRIKTFTEVDAAAKLKQVAKAIVYLHDNGIAHRDIKPENIVMSNGVGKLCDFGWATFCGNDRRKTYCGTFDYAAPQILEGSQYDLTVDLWCLGVLAYELLVGKAPFYHISRKETMKKILNVENEAIVYPSNLSKEAISFIDNLVKKNPEERMTGASILDHPFLKLAKEQQQ